GANAVGDGRGEGVGVEHGNAVPTRADAFERFSEAVKGEAHIGFLFAEAKLRSGERDAAGSDDGDLCIGVLAFPDKTIRLGRRGGEGSDGLALGGVSEGSA